MLSGQRQGAYGRVRKQHPVFQTSTLCNTKGGNEGQRRDVSKGETVARNRRLRHVLRERFVEGEQGHASVMRVSLVVWRMM